MSKIEAVKFKFKRIGKRSFVNSVHLYAALELDPHNYGRWIDKIIENQSLKEGEDYLYTDPQSKRGRPNKEYFLSMAVSHSVCINTRNQVGKKIRDFLRVS